MKILFYDATSYDKESFDKELKNYPDIEITYQEIRRRRYRLQKDMMQSVVL